jgi:hypothetical protein
VVCINYLLDRLDLLISWGRFSETTPYDPRIPCAASKAAIDPARIAGELAVAPRRPIAAWRQLAWRSRHPILARSLGGQRGGAAMNV